MNIKTEKSNVKKKSCPTEAQDQIAFVQWMSIHPILGKLFEDINLFHHSPNGGMRIKRTFISKSGKTYTYSPEGVKLKRMGTQSGFPDIFIPLPTKTYHGLFIELKPRFGGTVTFDQKKWLDAMSMIGYKTAVCHGFDESVKEVENYLKDYQSSGISKC